MRLFISEKSRKVEISNYLSRITKFHQLSLNYRSILNNSNFGPFWTSSSTEVYEGTWGKPTSDPHFSKISLAPHTNGGIPAAFT